jgi:serine/threonine protein phosphatase PrpC
MEDAHATVLDLQTGKGASNPAPADSRISFFGVYDGHGGDRVAQFAGENIHEIVAKQEAFQKGDFEQALKDGFLATDRAILGGQNLSHICGGIRCLLLSQTHGTRRKFPVVPLPSG